MLRRLRGNRAILIVSVALLVVGVCVPAIAVHLDAVLTPLWFVPPVHVSRHGSNHAPRVDEQTASLLSVLLSRAPPPLS